jgi:pSer/pThr/pTyr-binding forkhead associated (FHA) protein
VSTQVLNQFLEACGLNGPLHLNVHLQGKTEPSEQVLGQPFALVGRDIGVDLLLNHAQVSRRHAYLQVIAGRLFCLDLQSRTGVHWESNAQTSGWVDHGQAVRIGPYSIGPRLDHPNATAEAANEWNRAAVQFLGQQGAPQVKLEFLNGIRISASWKMTPMVALVGRSADCRVHLVGDSVSLYHCSLVRTPQGVWVVDLMSRGGIWINDQKARCGLLAEGDLLRVGKFIIRFRYETPPAANSAGSAILSSLADWKPPANGVSEEPKNGDSPRRNLSPELIIPLSPSPAQEMPSQPGRELMVVSGETIDATQATVQAMMVPLAKQMSLMQQQMFDQFQQSMMMMFQMFHTLQRDQIGLIRSELNRIEDLNAELLALQREAMQRTKTEAASPAAAVQPSSGPSRPVADVARSNPEPSPEKNSFELPPTPAAANDPNLHATLADRMAALHDERMKELQEERQNRWQKIVGFLKGKGGS